jgi:hypothetical protein
MPVAGDDPIVAFYSGGRDAAGRTLAEIVAWDDERLESVHDYIQWMFPTTHPSGVNPLAPSVTADTIRAFQNDPALVARLRRSLERMLLFYGLRWSRPRVEIDDRRFPARSRVWLYPGNHNHLRLTRIMDSAATLGLRDEARALQRCLLEDIGADAATGRVSARTREIWRRVLANSPSDGE